MRPDIVRIIILTLITALLILAAIGILSLISGHSFEYLKPEPKENRINPDSPEYQDQSTLTKIYRVTTAFTASPDETDDTPCQGALTGIDFCNPERPLIATNELPLETLIEINGTEYLVADRTNPRYKYRYDILIKTKQEAYDWGRQIKEIIVK